MNWFQGLRTPEEIKKHYRSLAMQHHPDRGGDTATMQDINVQYHAALQACDGQSRTDEQGTERTYRYREAVEQAVMDKIDELLRSGVVGEGVDVWLIGYWLWVEGNTRPIKETLKQMGFRWHSKRVCWYWHDGTRQHAFRGGTLDDIAAVYGAEHITAQRSSKKSGAAALAEVGL